MSELENIKYDKNYLKNVICRVDFASILKIKNELISDFQDNIRQDFPKYNENIVTIETNNEEESNSHEKHEKTHF